MADFLIACAGTIATIAFLGFVIWKHIPESRVVAPAPAPLPCHSSIETEEDVLTVYLDGETIEDAVLIGDDATLDLILLLNHENRCIGVQVFRLSSSSAWQRLPEAASIPADVMAEAVRIQAGVLGLGLDERESS